MIRTIQVSTRILAQGERFCVSCGVALPESQIWCQCAPTTQAAVKVGKAICRGELLE